MKRKQPDDTPERNDTDSEAVARRIAISNELRRRGRDGPITDKMTGIKP